MGNLRIVLISEFIIVLLCFSGLFQGTYGAVYLFIPLNTFCVAIIWLVVSDIFGENLTQVVKNVHKVSQTKFDMKG